MTSLYVSKGFTIHPNRQTIEFNGQVTSVRPKTFALLLLLLEHPQTLLSKRYLLDTVWDDVVVEEPVLVQSIRELRQLFNSADIIQTYPRKGYAWSAEVEKHFLNDEKNSIAATQTLNKVPSRWLRNLVIAVVSVAIILMGVFVLHSHRESNQPSTEVVIVLPVKNEMFDSSYDWVALGAMDQLINLLRADSKTQIMNLEYVLQLMQYVQLPRDNSDRPVSRIFEVSGASLVVETKLSGSVDNYRLDYKLHRKNDIKPGVIFDTHLESALQKLGAVVADYTGVTINSSATLAQNSFRNELMARALEKMDAGEFQLATNLLLSLKQLEPNNIVARQMLSRSLVRLKQFDAAKDEINSALAIANQKESARLYFQLAEVQLEQGLLNDALITLEHADSATQSANDTLFLGYIAQLRANILQERELFAPAVASYEQAIKYYGIIHCPIGASLAHLQMANLFITQGKMSSANTQYLAAKQLIEDHKLYKLEASLAQIKTKLH